MKKAPCFLLKNEQQVFVLSFLLLFISHLFCSTMMIHFYVVSLRWRPPKLIILEEDSLFRCVGNTCYIHSCTLFNPVKKKLPVSLAEARINEIKKLVKHQCPSHHVDFYIFLLAVICIICSTIFTFIARSLNISMWCPLLLLLVPTALSFWTSKRRSKLILKIKEV